MRARTDQCVCVISTEPNTYFCQLVNSLKIIMSYLQYDTLHVRENKLSNQFNDMKMVVEVKLARDLYMHQGRQLCCVKRDA